MYCVRTIYYIDDRLPHIPMQTLWSSVHINFSSTEFQGDIILHYIQCIPLTSDSDSGVGGKTFPILYESGYRRPR